MSGLGEVYRLADYSDEVTAAGLLAALAAGSYDGVWHYIAGANARRIESLEVIAAVRAAGIGQGGIDVPLLSTIDGARVATRAAQLGFPAGSMIALDIEPDEFNGSPAMWAIAAGDWCGAVRRAGYSPVVYGTDETVAACGNQADAIWRAVPGMCDPAGGQLDPAFFADRRAVQCTAAFVGGINFDTSFSQFSLGGETMALDPLMVRMATAFFDGVASTAPDGSQPVPPDWPNFVPNVLRDIQSKVTALSSPPAVDVAALAAALEAHLPPGVDPDAVAQAVVAHLASQLSKT